MPLTPQITLTATLKSILAGVATGGYLQVTLCGSGPVVPCVPGTCMLADATMPQLVGPQVGSTPLSITLFGNDVITPGPSQTFYSIAVLDSKKNVVQCGNYQFSGTATVDLSSAVQMVAPFGFLPARLSAQPCTGTVPGSAFTAPGTPIGVFYNGALLPSGQAFPTLSYTAVGGAITLNFATESGDRIDALCVV